MWKATASTSKQAEPKIAKIDLARKQAFVLDQNQFFEKIYPMAFTTVDEVLNQVRRISDTQFLISKFEDINVTESHTNKALNDFTNALDMQSKKSEVKLDKLLEVLAIQNKQILDLKSVQNNIKPIFQPQNRPQFQNPQFTPRNNQYQNFSNQNYSQNQPRQGLQNNNFVPNQQNQRF